MKPGIPWRANAEALAARISEIRRDLHMHPELSGCEVRTAGVVARELRNLGLEITEGVAKTGVVGLLRGASGGRCVALRADMDALPLEEANDVPYRSRTPGVMHACGHDVHTACALGAAHLLAAAVGELKGVVKFIFQPAEELIRGADQMIAEGVLDDPPVDAAIGFHVSPLFDAGETVFTHGAKMAGTTEFEIVIRGEGGHAGYPHAAIDPIPIAAQVIMALQTIVSRNIRPTDPVVLSIGVIEGGAKANIIASSVRLGGTIRFYSAAVRERTIVRMSEIAWGVSRSLGGEASVRILRATPPLTVDARATGQVMAACREALGTESVRIADERSMGGEDFAFIAERVPAAHFWLGVRPPGAVGWPPIHTVTFDVDERALPVGAAALAAGARALLEEPEE